ncbi:hypothetical protein RchiOBHm_Chr4g0433711 [Rosa chinensis]|uniref:Uncharacterized protein n=1 Tax=Rosa chinensis TaxID=74649 RepID=A0A2P6R1C3_ROSCH|nr:hypothetical protein RchiOBHm_Chr4g0433711 [Rosa chinensis]
MVGIFLHDLLPLTTVQTIPYRHLSFSVSRPLPTTSTIPTSLGLGCYSFLWSHLSSFVFSSIFSYLLDLSLQKRTNLLRIS